MKSKIFTYLFLITAFGVGGNVTWIDVCSHWLEQGECIADVNNDRIVNLIDFVLVTGHFRSKGKRTL